MCRIAGVNEGVLRRAALANPAPAQPEAQPEGDVLKDEQITEIWYDFWGPTFAAKADALGFARAIERAVLSERPTPKG